MDGAVGVVGGAWVTHCRMGAGPTGQGREESRRTVGRAYEGRTLRGGGKAGPRPLTVATKYCTVPQSLTARLKRSSRYCKEEPRAGGHLDRSYPGARGLWVLSRTILALPSLGRPASLSALSPAEAFAKRTHFDLSAYTLCTRAIPCLCPWHVPRRTELSNLHTSPLIPV